MLRAICLAHSGSQSGHAKLRLQAIGYIRSHPQQFIQDITFLCQCSVEVYCSKMSQNSVFGDDILLMACCILLGVNVQLYTLNSHLQNGSLIENLSRCTFSPVKGSVQTIRIHLDTGDSTQIRQGSIVIGRKQTRAPHYDTLAMPPRTPLSDITNLPANQITSTPMRMPTSALSPFPNIQKLMLNDKSYDASNGREFAKDLERIASSPNSDSEAGVAEVSFVSNASTLVQRSFALSLANLAGGSSSTFSDNASQSRSHGTEFDADGLENVDEQTGVQCGAPGCANKSFKSRVYTMRNLEKETKYWCSLHKWCSKCYTYELAGKCGYSIQIGRENNPKANAKVRLPLFKPKSLHQISASLTHLLQLVGI